jgi:tRNA (guanine37-N1)-methyltransferase
MAMLKQALSGLLAPAEIGALSSSFDVVGDIAIIKIPMELANKQDVIARTILSNVKHVHTVLKQVSSVQGEYRTRDLEFIAGEKKYETIYKENQCLFKVDLRRVYFSPRLSTERQRISSQVREGERVLNMFAGVGTFSIVIAKRKVCTIDSVDNNPAAFELANESLKLNKKLKGKVHPILSDARNYAESHKSTFDRVIMPLPERAREFLSSAIEASKRGATIHYYEHVSEENFLNKDWTQRHIENIGERKLKILLWRRVREVGPRYIQAVADLEVL